jgi:hypothetical protein
MANAPTLKLVLAQVELPKAVETISVSRIERAHAVVAMLLSHSESFLPIFERLEEELRAAMAAKDPIAKARSLLLAKA